MAKINGRVRRDAVATDENFENLSPSIQQQFRETMAEYAAYFASWSGPGSSTATTWWSAKA